jgi:hypothetical protein
MHLDQNQRAEDVQIELQLVKRLIQLSKTSWSPTLRANATIIEALGREIQAANASRRKAK